MKKDTLFLLVASFAFVIGLSYLFVVLRNASSEGEMTAMDAEHTTQHMMDALSVGDDRMFLQHMIPHHQEAVEASQDVLARGGSIPEVRQLAEDIMTSQQKEIEDMKRWYKEWYGGDFVDDGTYMAMMRDASEYSGKELDIIFVTDMLGHHESAVLMGRKAPGFTARPELRELSRNILISQQKEIGLMRGILDAEKYIGF